MSIQGPVCIRDIEKIAQEKLPKHTLDFYRSGANDEQTLKDNIDAFKRWRFRQRIMCDVSQRDLSTTIQGCRIELPICIAPSALHQMAHPDGEVATAKASSRMGTCYTMSTNSTCSIEEVFAANPIGLRWFQTYIYKDREITKQLIRRAEKHAYKAIVLTVDIPVVGKRLDNRRNKFSLPPHLRMANLELSRGINKAQDESITSTAYARSLFDASATWADLGWLGSITNLPIIVKGILTGEDALLAVKHGCKGILVSNHGGRQFDGLPATLDALPEVVAAVDGRCEVYLDGGVRNGTDVLKAIALGARAVFVGRPIIYGLAYNGEEGVKLVLQLLKDELSLAMALAGVSSLPEVTKALVVHQDYYLHPKL